ncbi:hypothetical protein J2W17_006241 [Pseudomonas lini]|uniref:hypothetical protein n=1 Tax=Pseudomonas lini TaxID=163011 RepID=UPI00278636CE|nr:hypothetical protein [Pseudomonas lini]MDQ0127241.1 hypothetical protein [Pseudomonas lini]
MAAVTYPAPKVPVNADNAVDLEELGSDNLPTLVWFPNMENFRGHFILVHWRGCTALGDVEDSRADENYPIDGSLTPEGLPIRFSNDTLQRLDQGWVFYSYSVKAPMAPEPGPESKRLFFYVGTRPTLTSHLAVPQVRESHDLALDPDIRVLPPAGVTVSVPPYAAMAKGDKVTLLWQGFDRNANPRPPLRPVWEVTDAQVGRPLTRLVSRNEVLLIAAGRLELSYSIVYAGGGEDSVSALQTLRIVAPTLQRLPELAIDDHGGGPVDPVRFPEGVTLRGALHPQARVGDTVMLNATVGTGTDAAVSVRLDPSTLDSGALALQLEHAWLVLNNRKTAELTYQYARPGSVFSSEPLRLLISQPLDISPPILRDAVPEKGDEPNEGRMDAANTTSGSRASVPLEAIVDETDTIHLYWGEPGTAGHSVVTTPVAGDWRAFDIPKNAIAMNMGAGVGSRDRLKVFWRVTPHGEPQENWQDSEPFWLKIEPYPRTSFPAIQCVTAAGTSELSLKMIDDPKGARFELGRWAYMAQDQILNIKVVGKDYYLIQNHSLTETEAQAPSFTSWLPESFLRNQIGIGNKFKVSVTVSFDQGRTHLPFRDSAELTLRA